MRQRVLWLSLATCLFLVLSSSEYSQGLSSEYLNSFSFWLKEGARRNYAYVWGGSDPKELTYDTKAKKWARGLDCSGYIFWAAKNAALPGVRRTRAINMARGLDGWVGIDLHGHSPDEWLSGAKEGDLPFFFNDYSHVGALLRSDKTGVPSVAHASSTRGTVMDEIKGPKVWPEKDFSKIRRLTIGDKK